MKVQCIRNTIDESLEGYLKPLGGFEANFDFDLTIGQEYVVYAIAVGFTGIWYYLCGDLHDEYPVAYPAPLFGVTESRLSRYWVYEFSLANPDYRALIATEDWISIPNFYDRLTDLEDEAIEAFNQLRQLIDEE